MGNNSFLYIAMFVIIAFFFFWTWRNNRKRQRDEQDKLAKLVPGAEIMTSQGIFGKVHSLDLDNNKVVLEVSPGTFLTVHRQTIARIDSTPDSGDEATDAAASAPAIDEAGAQAKADAAAGEPEFGERITPPSKTDE